MTSQTPRTGRVGVGLIGAGMISDTYLDNLTSFPDVEVLMVSDRDVPRAQAQAQKHGVPAWGGADDVLAHPDIELVVNLTIPAVHAQGRRTSGGRRFCLFPAESGSILSPGRGSCG